MRWVCKWNWEAQQWPGLSCDTWNLEVRSIQPCRALQDKRLAVSNAKHIYPLGYLKHHGYWAEFQGQICQVPLSPDAGIIICYVISKDTVPPQVTFRCGICSLLWPVCIRVCISSYSNTRCSFLVKHFVKCSSTLRRYVIY